MFGPDDDDCPEVAELEVDRHRLGRIEERVTGLAKDDVGADRHERPPPRTRERPAGHGEVEVGHRDDERDERCLMLPDGGRELAQDSRDLVALGALRLAEPVRVVDDRERLDEERLARAGAVVDDAGHAPTRRRPEREHRTTPALGHEVVLQVIPDRRVTGETLEPLRESRTALPALAPEPPERRRGAVAEIRSVRLDGLCDPLRGACKAWIDRLRQQGEAGDAVDTLERGPRGQRCIDRQANRVQCARVEDSPTSRDLGGGPDVPHGAQVGLCGLLEKSDRLGGHRLPGDDLVGIAARSQRECPFASRLARRCRGEAVEDLG